MGLPTTWSLLCLVHLFWISESVRIFPKPERAFLKKRAAVCGDDLVAHWPLRAINLYNETVCRCGGQISVKKHFIVCDAGVFTEECFFLPDRLVTRRSLKATVKVPSKIGVGRTDWPKLNESETYVPSPEVLCTGLA